MPSASSSFVEDQSQSEEELDITSLRVRWRALVCVCLAMFSIGHAQYTWTLFVQHFQSTLGCAGHAERFWSVSTAADWRAWLLRATESNIQLGFSIFVTLQTTTVLAIGVLISHDHRRLMMAVGSLALGAALLGMSGVQALWMLYSCCALEGFGVGAVYCNAISISVSIFPARKGLVAGVTAAFYGGGSLLTIAAIVRFFVCRGHKHRICCLHPSNARACDA